MSCLLWVHYIETEPSMQGFSRKIPVKFGEKRTAKSFAVLWRFVSYSEMASNSASTRSRSGKYFSSIR